MTKPIRLFTADQARRIANMVDKAESARRGDNPGAGWKHLPRSGLDGVRTVLFREPAGIAKGTVYQTLTGYRRQIIGGAAVLYSLGDFRVRSPMSEIPPDAIAIAGSDGEGGFVVLACECPADGGTDGGGTGDGGEKGCCVLPSVKLSTTRGVCDSVGGTFEPGGDCTDGGVAGGLCNSGAEIAPLVKVAISNLADPTWNPQDPYFTNCDFPGVGWLGTPVDDAAAFSELRDSHGNALPPGEQDASSAQYQSPTAHVNVSCRGGTHGFGGIQGSGRLYPSPGDLSCVAPVNGHPATDAAWTWSVFHGFQTAAERDGFLAGNPLGSLNVSISLTVTWAGAGGNLEGAAYSSATATVTLEGGSP